MDPLSLEIMILGEQPFMPKRPQVVMLHRMGIVHISKSLEAKPRNLRCYAHGCATVPLSTYVYNHDFSCKYNNGVVGRFPFSVVFERYFIWGVGTLVICISFLGQGSLS